MSKSATPWTAALPASLSITVSRSLLRLMSIESGMPSNHLTLCPLLQTTGREHSPIYQQKTGLLMHSKGNHKQNKKATHRMEENICKWSGQQGINLHSGQTACAAQYQKTNSLVRKWAEYINRYFSKEDIQMARKHLKDVQTLLIIREMQRETIMRYCLNTSQNGHHQKVFKQWILERVWRRGNPPKLLMGIEIGVTTMENSMKVP